MKQKYVVLCCFCFLILPVVCLSQILNKSNLKNNSPITVFFENTYANIGNHVNVGELYSNLNFNIPKYVTSNTKKIIIQKRMKLKGIFE